MSKYLSWIGVLLVLVGFHLMPNAEAQEIYVSPAILLGMNFDFSGDSGLEFYPSLSAQVTGGIATHDYSLAVGFTMLVGGATLGYQWSLGHPNNLYVDLQGGMGPLAGLGNLAVKKDLFVANYSGLLRLGWELNMTAGSG